MYKKRLLSKSGNSFFLFGPRGVGKTTWLKNNFPKELRFDLLSAKTFLDLSRDPSLLEAKIGNAKQESWILIDEIQKLPALLDEVHRLIEDKKYRFALTGSSARKLKRSGANLLAGRALTKEMYPLTSCEWPANFELDKALKWGGLPLAVLSSDPKEFLRSYFFTYIKEEIQEEGLIRRIDPFVRFLEVAGLLNGQIMNVENIARETGVKRVTLDNWFSILEDTLVGYRLQAWRPRIKVRESAHPKFYWFDPGVARAAAGLLDDTIDRTWLGYSFETWMVHEVRAYNSYGARNRQLFYYALPSDLDVDLIIETKKAVSGSRAEIVGVEFKLSKTWRREWEKPLRDLAASGKVGVRSMYGVYRGDEVLKFDQFTVLPAEEFLRRLHAGKIF